MKNKIFSKLLSFINKLGLTIFAMAMSLQGAGVYAQYAKNPNKYVIYILTFAIPFLCAFAFAYELTKRIIPALLYTLLFIFVIISLYALLLYILVNIYS